MSCSCCAQCQAELRDAISELGRALVERDHAILERDHVKELLADAKLDLANMTNKHRGTRVEDLAPGEDWAAKHCSDDATASYEALIKALRNDLEKEHAQNVALLGALKQSASLDTTSERDFRSALVVAVACGIAVRGTPLPGPVCDAADKIADELVEISRRISEALVDATKERDDLRAEVARLKEQLADRCVGRWLDDIEAENKQLKRIEVAAKAWRSCDYHIRASDVAGYIERGHGPNGEVK